MTEQIEETLEIQKLEEVTNKQKFTIFCGTYEGAILGLVGDLSKLDLKYAFKPSTNSLKCMDISGKYLVVGGYDEYLRIYDLKRQRECGILDSHIGTITNIKSHQNIVFSCAEDGLIKAWKMKEFALLHTLKEHKDAVNDIAIHSSGKILVSVAKDKRLIIWNLINAKKVFVMNLRYNAYKVAITEKHILTMSDYEIHVIDLETNQEVLVLKQDTQVILNDFQVYGEKFVVVGDNNGFIWVYDIETKYSISFRAHETRVKKLQVCRIDDMDIIVSISTSGEINIFDALIIFQDINNISESRVMEDLKPIYKVNTLNRLTSLSVYMNAAKGDKNKNISSELTEGATQLEKKNLKKPVNNGKKKNNKKVKVTIQKDEEESKSFVIDQNKLAKNIEKKKKKQLKYKQKLLLKKTNEQPPHKSAKTQQPTKPNEPEKIKKIKKSVRFQ